MFEFFLITLTNVLWIFYSIFEGIRESVFRNYEDHSKRNIQIDMGLIFNVQRILVLISISTITIWYMGWASMPIIIGQLLMFRYFHKISYRCTREKLKVGRETKNTLNTVDDIIIKKREKLVMFGITIQLLTYLFT